MWKSEGRSLASGMGRVRQRPGEETERSRTSSSAQRLQQSTSQPLLNFYFLVLQQLPGVHEEIAQRQKAIR